MASIQSYQFKEHSPAGFYIACRMGFVAPQEEMNSFPPEWVRIYTSRGYMLSDPVIRWAYENNGETRWSGIKSPDPNGVMAQARGFGLNFGAVISYRRDTDTNRTFGSFARTDREFSDFELTHISDMLVELHENRTPPTNLTAAELEVLAMLKQGMLMKQVAVALGVSESAIKGRLRNAKLKLSAKTNTHAASVASELGLI